MRLTQKAFAHANLASTQICTRIIDEQLEGALKSFRCVTVRAQDEEELALPHEPPSYDKDG